MGAKLLIDLVGVQVDTVGLAPWRIRTSWTPIGVFDQTKYPWPFATDPVKLGLGETALRQRLGPTAKA